MKLYNAIVTIDIEDMLGTVFDNMPTKDIKRFLTLFIQMYGEFYYTNITSTNIDKALELLGLETYREDY